VLLSSVLVGSRVPAVGGELAGWSFVMGVRKEKASLHFEVLRPDIRLWSCAIV
jgi:hypothetical protein